MTYKGENMYFVIVKFKGKKMEELYFHSGTDCYTEHCAPIFLTEEDAVDYMERVQNSEDLRIVKVDSEELRKIKGVASYERQEEEEDEE
jgi:hypothetical protein